MSNSDDFFTPEEVDRQINQAFWHQEGERADAEAIAYLRNLYAIDTQQGQGMLDRVWSRIEDTSPSLQHNLQQKQEGEEGITLQNQRTLGSNRANRATQKRSRTLMQRLSVLAAAVFLVALVGSMALLFYSIRHNAGGPASGGPTPPPIITTVPPTSPPPPPPTPSPTPRPVPFKVTSVSMSVMPASIAGIACGTNLTVTYQATIHVVANSPGGTVQFSYTVNNGRSQNTASVTFAPGETSKTYSFTWSGALPADHTFPEPGGINITSPNSLLSSLVGPTGICT